MTVSPDGFERWTRRFALYLIVAPPGVFVGTLLLDSGRRVIVAAHTAVSAFASD